MPSSQTSSVEQLTALYDSAFEAATRGKLDRVTALLNKADGLLEGIEKGVPVAELKALQNAHARLRSTLLSAMDSTRKELGDARKSAKAISAYAGGARRPKGARHRSSL